LSRPPSTPPALFCYVYFSGRVLKSCWGQPSVILPLSSLVAGTTGVSHHAQSNAYF
jgi:hypothetical protein